MFEKKTNNKYKFTTLLICSKGILFRCKNPSNKILYKNNKIITKQTLSFFVVVDKCSGKLTLQITANVFENAALCACVAKSRCFG